MIPTFEEIFHPLLQALNQHESLTLEDCSQLMADTFSLSDAERSEYLNKGRQTVIKNRTGWAKFYLEKAGLLETISRGVYRITELGSQLLDSCEGQIDVTLLRSLPQFKEFYEKRPVSSFGESEKSYLIQNVVPKTPDEILDEQYGIINQSLAEEILHKIMEMSPGFFERLVISLLESMGYGQGKVTGRTGDGGIDGIIGEDKLGLDVIHIQAKRWNVDNKVGRKELQSFVGALAGQSGRKGVFITTSSFTRDALDYNPANVKIARIDGDRLAHLMIEYNVGVDVKTTYELKKLDLDFFVE